MKIALSVDVEGASCVVSDRVDKLDYVNSGCL